MALALKTPTHSPFVLCHAAPAAATVLQGRLRPAVERSRVRGWICRLAPVSVGESPRSGAASQGSAAGTEEAEVPKRALYSPPPPTVSAAQFAAAQVPNTASKRPCISAAQSLANCARNPSLTNQVSPPACPCRPVRRPRYPLIPRMLRLAAVAQAARASGCPSSAPPKLDWIAAGSAPEPHSPRCRNASPAQQIDPTAPPARTRQIHRTSRGHWKRPALKTDTAR